MIAGDLWERQVTEFTWLVPQIGECCSNDNLTGGLLERWADRRKLSPARAVDLIDLQDVLRPSVQRWTRLESVTIFQRGEEEQFAVEVRSVLCAAGNRAIGIPQDNRIATEKPRSIFARVGFEFAVLVGVVKKIDDSLVNQREFGIPFAPLTLLGQRHGTVAV